MLKRLIDDDFNDDHDVTVGVEFGSYLIKVEDKILKLRADQIEHGIYNEINGSIEEKVLQINDKLEQRGLHNKNNFSRWIENDLTN